MARLVAYLKALTPEARLALKGQLFKLSRFPFRVGRESRLHETADFPDSRRRPNSIPNNDLYLVELADLLNVSREHFLIAEQDGMFFLVDRGSTCGTLVEGEVVGGDRQGGRRRLADQDVIIVGTSKSQFVFKFVLEESL